MTETGYIIIIAAFVVICVLVGLAGRAFKTVSKRKVLIVEVDGKHYRTLEPGYRRIKPFGRKIVGKVNTLVQTHKFITPKIPTLDEENIQLDVVLRFKVFDATKYYYEINNNPASVKNAVARMFKDVISYIPHDDVYPRMQRVLEQVLTKTQDIVQEWGVNIVEIKVIGKKRKAVSVTADDPAKQPAPAYKPVPATEPPQVHHEVATPAKVESRPVSLEPVAEVTPEESVDAVPTEESYFDGRLLQLIGWRLITFFVSLITLGLALPWAVCSMYRWEMKHMVINGKRLRFDGKAMSLFWTWIKWILLSIITIGIYGLWIPIKLKKWVTKHTHFAEEAEE